MTDNFKKIKALLSFPSPDIFYFAQILKRKKEHPELGSNSTVIKTYYLKSPDALDFYRDEMIALANLHNARVYISLNQRSFERTAYQTLKKVVDQIMNKDYPSVRKSYSSVCGMFAEGDKTWIIDVDYPSKDPEERRKVNRMIDDITLFIIDLEPVGVKHIAYVPTKNGIHIITRPFNVQKFKEKYPNIDVHKNNPTLLYCS